MKMTRINIRLTESQKEDLLEISATEIGAPSITNGVRYLIEKYKRNSPTPPRLDGGKH